MKSKLPPAKPSKSLALTIPLLLLAGCQSGGTSVDNIVKQRSNDKQAYSAKIQRTSHNIPHITADNMPSAWFGQGYAMAEDRICVLLDQITKVRSHRAKFFGAGEYGTNLSSDFGYKHLGLLSNAEKSWSSLPADIQAMLTAHATGINKYIKDTGTSKLPQGCRDAAWVTQVTPTDLMAIVSDFNILLSGRFLVSAMSDATPPTGEEKKEGHKHQHHVSAEPYETPGSNGWGLGSDLTQSGNGILLAQPHFPWEGELQAWESHVTVPGEIDIYGITVPGIPNNLVGFNASVAWTLTVTTSPKATLYQLKLAESDPTKYLYDGKVREMKSTDYTIDVLTESGKIEQQSRTLWHSHYGPMLSVPAMLTGGIADYSWSKNLAMTYRDINLDNQTLLSQFLAMSQANGIKSFIGAHKKWAGSIPFSNTVATSIEGEAWYADSSPVPNISKETYQAWQATRKKDAGIAALSEYHNIYVFDGSTSRDEWVTTHSNTHRDGLIPFDKAPQLRRKDFVFNSNGTHWLSNPNSLLEGYPPIYGEEGDNPSLRTRMNAMELAKGDAKNKFSLHDVKEISLANRSITASLVTKELVKRCQKTPVIWIKSGKVDLNKACTVLEKWDQTFNLDSQGAVLFREFLGFVSSLAHGHALFTGEDTLFAKSFDRKEPILTPNGLSSSANILVALGQAINELSTAKIPLNATLRDYQFAMKNDKKIPIHGGNSREGILSIAAYSSNATLLPSKTRGKTINSVTGLTKDGYMVNYGTSFLMAVELTPKGPECQAIMSFSQSIDPDSPYFSDQTELYSDKKWRACHYSQKDILADPDLKTYTVKD